jgi:DNA (cytosine-5)-methyltransferase 1
VKDFGGDYLLKVLEVEKSAKLTSHRARLHSERDLRDFARLREGESSAEAMRRGIKFEFPYDKSSFKDRYTRQSRWHACSTIVAHLSKDGLMFIHPTQNRSLTVREAARIQSFPDWFSFPIARTHQFRVIGNAVPPLVSEAVGIAVAAYIKKAERSSKTVKFTLTPLPRNQKQAIEWLVPVLDTDAKSLRKISPPEFKRTWYAVAFIYPGLHPDGALEHGHAIIPKAKDHPLAECGDSRLIAPYYAQSGWPVALAALAKEAWRRYQEKNLSEDEFYCSEAQIAGMCHRNPNLASEVARERERLAA